MVLSPTDKLLINHFFATRPIKKAYLLGSYARHEANDESDIDILVELDHSQPIGMKFFAFRSDLEELLKKKVDLVSSEGLSRHVRPFVDRDKTLLYEREND